MVAGIDKFLKWIYKNMSCSLFPKAPQTREKIMQCAILSFHETIQPQFGVLMRGTIMTEDGCTDLLYYFDDPSMPLGVSLLAAIDDFVATSLLDDSRLHPSNENNDPICLSARINIDSQRATIQIHKPTNDAFLMILRTLWGDEKMSFNEWVGRIAGANRGILQSKEIERLMALQNFTPNPSEPNPRYPAA